MQAIVEFNRNWRANRWRDALWFDLPSGTGGDREPSASSSSPSDASRAQEVEAADAQKSTSTSPAPAPGASRGSSRPHYSPDAIAFFNEPNRSERVRLLKRLVDAHLAACTDAEHCARRFTPALQLLNPTGGSSHK